MVNEIEFKKANNYSLKCMRVTFIVLVIAWILNVLHIFIVDQTIMNSALIGVTIFVLLGHAVKYVIGFEKAASNYIMLFLLVAMISFANMELAYHASLFMIFPMVTSIVYTEKKYKSFTFALTIGGFFLSVVGGYYWGLCDANKLLLTTTTSTKEAEALLAGTFNINTNLVNLILFFAFPRIMALVAFNAVLNYIKNTLLEKIQKEQEGMQMAELLKKCESASEELVTMVGNVEENLENSRRANEQIISSARDTSEDCDESRSQVVHIQERVSEMSEAIDGIYQNTKEIVALNIVCTRPKELTRESLRSLRLTLDREGFTTQQLNTAVSQMTNEEITADIISLIRRYAIGSALIPHEARIKQAVDKLKKTHKFSKQELNWISRMEKYLMEESVLNVDVFDEDGRFKAQGGFAKINKVFGNKLESIILELNEHLYDDGGKIA